MVNNIMERRPDSFWSCLVCAASVLSILIATSGPYAFGLLLPPLMDEFNANRQETGKWNLVLPDVDTYLQRQTRLSLMEIELIRICSYWNLLNY